MAQTMRDVYELQGRADVGQLNTLIATLDDLGGAIADMDRAGNQAADGAGVAERALDAMANATIVARGAMSALGGIASGAGAILRGTAGAVLEQEAALRQFRVATGSTAEEMGRFQDSVDRVFTSGFGDGPADILDTMQRVNAITGETGYTLEELTRGATIMEQVWGTDVNESIRAADTAAENFRINNQRAMDVLAAGFQQTGDPAGDLADTFNEYSANFAQMGFGANQFLDILNQGLENGARNTDDVADAFREFQIRLMDGTSAEAIAGLGPELQALQADFQAGEASAAQMSDGVLTALRGIEDPIARNAAGVEIFGTRWEDMGEDVLLGIDPINDAAASMDDLDGTMADAQRTLQDGIGPAWRRFTRVVQSGMIDSLEPLGPFLNNTLTPALEDLGGWLGDEGVPALVDFGAALFDNAEFALTHFGRALDALQGGNLTRFAASFKTAFDALGALDIGAQLTNVIMEPIRAWFGGVDWGALVDSGMAIGRTWLTRLVGNAMDYTAAVWETFGAPVVTAFGNIDWVNEIAIGDGSLGRQLLERLLGGGSGGDVDVLTAATAGMQDTGGLQAQAQQWATDHIVSPLVEAIAGIQWEQQLAHITGFATDVFEVLKTDTLPDLQTWATDNIGRPLMNAVGAIEWGVVAEGGLDLLSNVLDALMAAGGQVRDAAGAGGSKVLQWATDNIARPLMGAIAGVPWGELAQDGMDLAASLLNPLLSAGQDAAGAGADWALTWATDNIGRPLMNAVGAIAWGELALDGLGLVNRVLNALIGDGGQEGEFNLGDWATDNIGTPLTTAIRNIDWAGLFTGGANILAGILDAMTAGVENMASGEGEGVSIDMSWLMNAMTAGVVNMWGEDGAISWTRTNLIDPIFAGLMNADYSALGDSLSAFGDAVGTALLNALPDWGTWVMDKIIQPIVDGLKSLPDRVKGMLNDAIPPEITFNIPEGQIPGSQWVPGGPWFLGGGDITLGPIPNPFPNLGEYAGGGSFVVPGGGMPIPGSTDQRFAIALTPGEGVDVTPRGQVGRGGGGVRQPVQVTLPDGRALLDFMLETDADNANPRLT